MRLSQEEIDVKNLLFYAEMFRQHKWGTVVIHWSVFEATLKEIAGRIDATRGELQRTKDALAAAEKSLTEWRAFKFRLDAGTSTEQQLAQSREVAEKLAEALERVCEDYGTFKAIDGGLIWLDLPKHFSIAKAREALERYAAHRPAEER